jgi:conjugative relaxase-like TrwC/TraI family protein
MLRIIERHSPAETLKYFDVALATSDYYVRGPGMWGGKGAQWLGLKGEVKREDFVALANNRVTGKDETLTLRLKQDRRTGYDFCFDVPKSVSLYLVLNNDKAVKGMIEEAFLETMAEVEGRIEARLRKAGAQQDPVTGNLVFASFIHRETRSIHGIPDPHYHIHAFTFNATFDEVESVWKPGQFVNAKRNGPLYEAAFNARLADKLIAADLAFAGPNATYPRGRRQGRAAGSDRSPAFSGYPEWIIFPDRSAYAR